MSPPKMIVKVQNSHKKILNGSIKKNVKINDHVDRFEYGNYNRYYGYRNISGTTDCRIEAFLSRRELFLDRDVLDIGCNIGHVTYVVGRDLGAKTVLGIDIDNSLIKTARKNTRFYHIVTSPCVTDLMEKFEISTERSENVLKFPYNVSFLHSNYVLHHDDLLARDEPKYDVILCLSVTKWIHLNWGDEGLIRTFRRMFIQLRSGGVLVLEAQPIESYRKRKIPTKLRLNVEKIKLFPTMFDNYLLSEIGFKSCETLAVPAHKSKGFQRPIKLFFKE